jgi:hypothetical protein
MRGVIKFYLCTKMFGSNIFRPKVPIEVIISYRYLNSLELDMAAN